MRSLGYFFILFFSPQALGQLELVNEWNGGWQAILTIIAPVATTDGWTVALNFHAPSYELLAFDGAVDRQEGNTWYVNNESWNPVQQPGASIKFEFLIRYAEGGTSPILESATFQDIDIPVGNNPAPTTTPGTTGPTTTREPGFEYNYGEVIGLSNLFYEAQRCGVLPANNRIPWRGDSFINDQGDAGLDLTGGYFDAGDHVKFGFPFAGFTTLIAWGLLDFEDGYVAAGELDNGLATLKWSLDYFIKAHPEPNVFYAQVGDGAADHAYWGRPEDWPAGDIRKSLKITQQAPGSDLAGETAAAFAASSLVFQGRNATYAAELLRHATELYAFANTHRAAYSDSLPEVAEYYNSWSGFGDELLWAAAWMYKATGSLAYLNDIQSHWTEFNGAGRPAEFGWDDKKAGAQILLAKEIGSTQYIVTATAFCDYMVGLPRSPLGLTFISQWGALRHVSNVAFICLQLAEAGVKPEVYREFAKSQIDYILGDGGRSYVVGFGSNPPQRPHHRSSSCPDRPAACSWNEYNNPGPNPQTLTGALVGGPDGQDQYVDDRDDYIKNEVTTDYNAGFQGALAALNSLRVRGLLRK